MPLIKFKIRQVAVKPPLGGLTAKLASLAIFAVVYLLFANFVYASAIDDLKKKIEDRNTQIKQVQEEIEKYQKEIENTGNRNLEEQDKKS